MVQEVARRTGKSRRKLGPEFTSDVRHLGSQIEGVIQAFETPDQRDQKGDREVTFGKHKVGRMKVDENGRILPHLHPLFDHYYELSDPQTPNTRSGIVAIGDNVSYYEIITGENGEQISYPLEAGTQKTLDLLASFQRMPHFPGDLRS